MKVSRIALSVAVALVGGAAHAGGFIVSKDITVNGDLSAGAYYVVNNGGMGAEAFDVTDFGLAFSAPAVKTGDVGFKGVIGRRVGRTILDTSPNGSFGFGGMLFDFGYATLKPVDNVTVDVGYILTTVGNEASPSIFSANVNRGFMWNAQPSAYNGIRASYAMGDMTLSAEVNHSQSSMPDNPVGFALSVSGKASGASYSATYFDKKDDVNIVDLVANTELGGMDVGVNFDYFMLDKKGTKKDDSATGVGFYVTPKMGKMTVPVRVEFVSDGDSGVYAGVKSGYSLTVTPTMKMSDNTYVRAEFSYVGSDNKIFSDKDAKPTDSQTMLALQMGYTF